MDLLQILEQTISHDKGELENAQRFLENAIQQNLPELLVQLGDILRNPVNSQVARMQAGLQLKNCLISKDENIQQVLKMRWLALPEDIRTQVKTSTVATLGTEQSRPSTAAQCIASIASAELPNGQWTEIIPLLTANVTNPESTSMLKEATLEAIGYICQDIDADLLQEKSNEILTAIVFGMKKEETSIHVRLAATNALLNSLEFTRSNFEKDEERHFIMRVVCEATQAETTQVKVAALQCLVKIMSLYYSYMEHYMSSALFAITLQAMNTDDDDDVCLQGIEFWSNVCDEEVDLAIEYTEATEQGQPPERTSRFYAKGALKYLVPRLLQLLTKQDENDDDDEWNPCKAAGVCLMLLASCTEDDIVQLVIPFVENSITSPDWKLRDAAVMAFGSILDGPDPNMLTTYILQALPLFINLLKDSSVVVRDSTAWTIGRICEVSSESILDEKILRPLLEALVENLNAEPRVASNVCWAISTLSESAVESATDTIGDEAPATYKLTPYFAVIVEKLLLTTDRPDGNNNNLRSAAYEALMEMVKNSAKDCYEEVKKTTVIILDRLQKVIQAENSGGTNSSEKAYYTDLQSLLCATLQSVLRKVTAEDAPQISDQIMAALLEMLRQSGLAGASGEGVVQNVENANASSLQEDALMTISALIQALGVNFGKYMDAFMPFLIASLHNKSDYDVCVAAVNVIGDISRAMGADIYVHCDQLVTILLEILQDESVHRKVKPQVLSCFGDLGMALGSQFEKYLGVVIGVLVHVTDVQVDRTDYELVEYINQLWESALEAYVGMVHAFKAENGKILAQASQLEPAVPGVLAFLEKLADDPDRTDAVLLAACGLLGDLVTTFGESILDVLSPKEAAITSLITSGRKSKNQKTHQTANWASREIRRVRAPKQTTVTAAAT